MTVPNDKGALPVPDCRVIARIAHKFVEDLERWTDYTMIREVQHDMSALADTLLEDADHRTSQLQAEILPGDGLSVGDRVRLATVKAVSNYDYGHGEYGEVASIDPDGMYVRIHLEKYHDDLDEWGNCFVWSPDDVFDDSPGPMTAEMVEVVEWLRPQLEVVTRCTHYFSHLNDELTGERVCTTCGAQGFEYDEHIERWLASDRVQELVATEAKQVPGAQLDARFYHPLWEAIDGLTTYQLSEQFETAVLHCIDVLRRQNAWPTPKEK